MSRILVVDDEAVYSMIINEYLGEDGHVIDTAEDGEAAWALMAERDYDLLIFDRVMPRLDGLSLLRRAKADPRWHAVPVILQTAATRQEEVCEGIEAGAYYYLTKPYEPRVLRTLVSTILGDIAQLAHLREVGAHLQAALQLITQCELSFRSLADARNLAAACASLCKDSDSIAIGLLELMVNAVEHGNLGITYAEKSQLRLEGQWDDEIANRLQTAPWSSRRARLWLRRDGREIEFTIRDEGNGFDWKPFLEFSAERAFDLNGRGIAMARQMSFNSLEYLGCGNEVVARAAAAD
jgi:DNA-binding response OmpR family regulator